MMEILFTSFARAGGIEIPEGKRIFSQPAAKRSLEARQPGRLQAGLGLLLRHAGKAATALGERLVAPAREASLKVENCR